MWKCRNFHAPPSSLLVPCGRRPWPKPSWRERAPWARAGGAARHGCRYASRGSSPTVVTSPFTGPAGGPSPTANSRDAEFGGRDRRWRRRGGAGEGCGDAVSGVTREAVDRPRAGPVSQQRTGAGRRVGRAARPARVHHRGSLLAAPRRGHRAAESAHGRSRVMTTAVGEGKEPPRGSGPDRHAPHGEPAAAAARLERDGGHAAFLRFWGPHRRLRCRHTSERGPWSEAAGNRVTACMACDMSMCTPTPCASSGEGGRPPQAPRGAHRTYSPVATRNACCAEDRVR